MKAKFAEEPAFNSPLMRKFNQGQEDIYNLPLRAKILATRNGAYHQPSSEVEMLAKWDKFNDKVHE
jgi:hypothetical protein